MEKGKTRMFSVYWNGSGGITVLNCELTVLIDREICLFSFCLLKRTRNNDAAYWNECI